MSNIVSQEYLVTPQGKIFQARILVWSAEQDLKRELSEGERRDLLCDSTNWTQEVIRLVEYAAFQLAPDQWAKFKDERK